MSDELDLKALLEEDDAEGLDLNSLINAGIKAKKGPAEPRKMAMLLNGLTFGLRPRIAAAVETGAVSGPEYEAAKKAQWAKDDAYAKENPVTAFALEAAGSVPTMLVPGMGGARIAQAAARGGQATQGLGRGARMARALGVGAEIGTVGQEAGALGLKSAALTACIGSRENSLPGRLQDAAVAAPIGYAGGRALNAIGSRFAGAAEDIRDMNLVGGTGEFGALTALRRGIDRDGLTTNDIRNAIIPNMGRSQITPQAQQTILRSYSAAINAGQTEQQARAAARQAYSQVASVAPDTADDHVRNLLNTYQEQNQIPLALDEAARLAGGSGQNLQWTRRAAQASAGPGRETAMRAIHDRQQDIIPAVRNRVTDTLGDPDLETYAADLVRRNRAAESAIYGASRAQEQPFDLSRVFDEVQATHAFRGGKAQQIMAEAARIMRGDPLPDGSYQRHTLDTYIQARDQLGDLIEESMITNPATGQQRGTTATRALMDLKTKMDEVVGNANPRWLEANTLTRGGRSAEQALGDAARMKLTGGDAHTRRVVNDVQRIRAEIARLGRGNAANNPQNQARRQLLETQLEAYRTGFARAIHTGLSELGDTHDVSKLFMKGGRDSPDGVRRVVRVMMGDEADDFMRMIERAQIATTTLRQTQGSQTTPLREAIDEMNNEGNVAAGLRGIGYLMNPRQMASDVTEAISNRLNADRNAALLRRYSTTTENPDAFMGILDELDNYALNRSGAFTNPTLNAYSAPGVVGGAFMGSAEQEKRRR